MLHKTRKLSRRSLLKSASAFGGAALAGSGLATFNVRRSLAAQLPDPASVLAKINVGNYVKKEYREQYKLGDNDLLWDPAKDWIRTVDWEAVRKEHAGKK